MDVKRGAGGSGGGSPVFLPVQGQKHDGVGAKSLFIRAGNENIAAVRAVNRVNCTGLRSKKQHKKSRDNA